MDKVTIVVIPLTDFFQTFCKAILLFILIVIICFYVYNIFVSLKLVPTKKAEDFANCNSLCSRNQQIEEMHRQMQIQQHRMQEQAQMQAQMHAQMQGHTNIDRSSTSIQVEGLSDMDLQEISPADIAVVDDNVQLVHYPYSMQEVFDIDGRRICRHKFGTYEIIEFYDVFTKEECNSIIEMGEKNGMVDSEVMIKVGDSLTGLDKQARISKQTWLVSEQNPILKKFSTMNTRLTGLPEKNQEAIQVASYVVGGKYEPHFDACVSPEPGFCEKSNRGAGQRRATLMVYLNDEFEGGKTQFMNLNFEVKPVTGKAILFFSTDTSEKIFRESLHKAAEVTAGKKWIATIWSHPYPWNEELKPGKTAE
jgi:prolyl 4-hydroxylase